MLRVIEERDNWGIPDQEELDLDVLIEDHLRDWPCLAEELKLEKWIDEITPESEFLNQRNGIAAQNPNRPCSCPDCNPDEEEEEDDDFDDPPKRQVKDGRDQRYYRSFYQNMIHSEQWEKPEPQEWWETLPEAEDVGLEIPVYGVRDKCKWPDCYGVDDQATHKTRIKSRRSRSKDRYSWDRRSWKRYRRHQARHLSGHRSDDQKMTDALYREIESCEQDHDDHQDEIVDLVHYFIEQVEYEARWRFFSGMGADLWSWIQRQKRSVFKIKEGSTVICLTSKALNSKFYEWYWYIDSNEYWTFSYLSARFCK